VSEPRVPEEEAVSLPTSPEVVAILVANHRRFLAFLERRVGSREVAEDILQDAFVRGLAGSARVRDEDSVIPWFYRSLRNALVDHWRRRSAEDRAVERVAALAEDSVAGVDAELEETVCACATDLLGTLKPTFADALRRVDLDGLSVKAFAEEAGITANSASVRLFRGRKALREQLQLSCGTCADHGCLDCSCSHGSTRPQTM
jgi:RNA polymerase sigma-70 factor (ECF subfamily)